MATKIELAGLMGSLVSTDNKSLLVANAYEVAFNRAPDAGGEAFWIDALENGGLEPVNLLLAILYGADAYVGGTDAATDALNAADKAVVALKATVADTLATDGITGTDAAGYLGDVVDAATQTSTLATIAAAQVVTDPDTPVEVTDTSIMLTASTDRGADFAGTAESDTFVAWIEQNSFTGGVSNSLSSADHLDGAGSIDTLHAELTQEFIGSDNNDNATTNHDVQPHTANIENITFENINDNSLVTVDAKHMTDIDSIGSSFSDGDVKIENLTTLESDGSLRNTETITVTMDHTDNFNSDNDASDLTVLFDEDYLLSGQSTSVSQANYWLLDEASSDYVVEPLLNAEKNGVVMTIDGTTVSIEMTKVVAQGADTWTEFAAALQDVIDAKIAAGESVYTGLTATVDTSNMDGTYNNSGTYVPIPAIAIIDAQGRTIVPTGFTVPEDSTGVYDIYGNFNNIGATTSNNPVTINVELEKVGRDGEGGDLVIGAKDQNSNTDTDVDQVDGIAVFNIDVLGTVAKPSNLGSISSTNSELTTVNIASETRTDNSYAALTIRDAFNGTNASLSDTNATNVATVNANSFKGDLNVGSSTAMLNVNTFTAAGGGKVTLNANIDGTEKGTFSITTGSNTDTVTVNVDGDAVDTTGTSFTANTGAANDTVNVTMSAGVSFATMDVLSNLSLDTSSGNDTINLDAYGTFDVQAGSGDDFVNINSIANNGNSTAGAWTFGQATGTQNWGTGFGIASMDERVLYNASLTVSFAGIEETVTVATTAAKNFIASQEDINAAIKSAIEGNSVLAKLLTVANGTGEQQISVTSTVGGLNDLGVAIYQPQIITGAIATGLTAGQNINITSSDEAALRTGLVKTTNLDSDNLATTAAIVAALDAGAVGSADLFSGSISATGVGSKTTFSTVEYSHDTARTNATDSGTDIFDASAEYYTYTATSANDNANNNFSTIEGDTGNDLVVLHSNVTSANTLVLDGAFGNDTIVNFHDMSPNDVTVTADVGNHIINFKHLDNQSDTSTTISGNSDSAENILTTVNIVTGLNGLAYAAAGTKTQSNDAVANSVSVLRFVENATDSFDGITSTNLLAALNTAAGAAAYGNITTGTLNAANVNAALTLVGTTQKHVIIVENAQNQGEYKVFEVESTVDATGAVVNASGAVTAGFFSAAVETGKLDFGSSINFVAGGSNEESVILNGLNAIGTDGNGNAQTGTANGTGALATAEALASADATVTADSAIINASGTYTITEDVALTTQVVTTGQTIVVAGVDLSGSIAGLTGVNIAGAGTVTVTDAGAIAAASLIAVDLTSAITLNATAATSITGTAANVTTVQAAAGITTQATDNVTVSDAAAADVVATVISALATNYGTVTLTNAIDLTGTHLETAAAHDNVTGTANAIISESTLTAIQLATLDTAIDGTITTSGGTLSITATAGAMAATAATDTFIVDAADTGLSISGLAVNDIIDLAADISVTNNDGAASANAAGVIADGDWFFDTATDVLTYWDVSGAAENITLTGVATVTATGADDLLTIASLG